MSRRSPQHRAWSRITVVVALGLALGLVSACGTDKKKIEGKRIPVLVHEQKLVPDAAASTVPVFLPPVVTNVDWPQSGGDAAHAPGHVALSAAVRARWQVNVGTGTSRGRPRLAAPVVGDGRIFAMDTEHVVTALDAGSGAKLWQVDLAEDIDEDDDLIVGGIAFTDGRLAVTTGFNELVLLDAENGAVLWRREVDAPIHAPPTISDGRIFVISTGNVLTALDGSGKTLWTHKALTELAGLVGGASPAVAGDLVVAPFTSGELVGLRAADGRMIWNESLAGVRRTDELATLSHIRANPVIDRGRVYAISHGGALAALDARSGQQIWEKDIGGLHMPWVIGPYLFQLTTDNDLVCLRTDDGRVIWVTRMPEFEDEEDKEGAIVWQGPVLAGNRLLLFGSNKQVLSVSPLTGEIDRRLPLDEPVSTPPAIAGETLYLLDDDANLTAFR